MRDLVTLEDAAKLLGVLEKTVLTYITRKKLEATLDRTHVYKDSLEKYKAGRHDGRRWGGLKGGSKFEKIRNEIKEKVYQAILEQYLEQGTIPIYDVISEKANLAKSGVGRYVKMLIADGKIEVTPHNGIYLAGLRELLKKVVKENYVLQKDTTEAQESEPKSRRTETTGKSKDK
jgi:hypothetical protein